MRKIAVILITKNYQRFPTSTDKYYLQTTDKIFWSTPTKYRQVLFSDKYLDEELWQLSVLKSSFS